MEKFVPSYLLSQHRFKTHITLRTYCVLCVSHTNVCGQYKCLSLNTHLSIASDGGLNPERNVGGNSPGESAWTSAKAKESLSHARDSKVAIFWPPSCFYLIPLPRCPEMNKQ